MKIKPITPELEDDVWAEWKVTIPRTISLSQAIEDLLRQNLKKKR